MSARGRSARSYTGLADLSRSSSSSSDHGARVVRTVVSRGGTVGSPRHKNRSRGRTLGFVVQRTSTTVHLCPWSSVMIREVIMVKNHTSNGSAPKGCPLNHSSRFDRKGGIDVARRVRLAWVPAVFHYRSRSTRPNFRQGVAHVEGARSQTEAAVGGEGCADLWPGRESG